MSCISRRAVLADSVASSLSRRLFAAFAMLAALLVAGGLIAANADAAPKPPYTVAVAPTSVVWAGSTGNNIAFTFTALGSTSSNVSVRVPTSAGWTAPQSRDATTPRL